MNSDIFFSEESHPIFKVAKDFNSNTFRIIVASDSGKELVLSAADGKLVVSGDLELDIAAKQFLEFLQMHIDVATTAKELRLVDQLKNYENKLKDYEDALKLIASSKRLINNKDSTTLDELFAKTIIAEEVLLRYSNNDI